MGPFFSPSRRMAEAYLLLITAIWGTTFIVIQEGLVHWPPFLMMASRFALAAAVLWPFAARGPWGWPLGLRGTLLGLTAFCGFALQTCALGTSERH